MTKFKDEYEREYAISEANKIIEDLKRAKKYGKRDEKNVFHSNIAHAKMQLDNLVKYINESI